MQPAQEQQQAAEEPSLIPDVLPTLPDQLLESIIGLCSSQDKKHLRQTCRRLCNVLDSAMTTAVMTLKDDDCPETLRVSWLQHMQHSSRLKALCITHQYSYRFNQINLLMSMPPSITSIFLVGVSVSSLEPLARLPRLTTLCLHDCTQAATGLREMEGLEHLPGLRFIHGLTRLQVIGRVGVGSVAHLAPTLRRLQLWLYSNVKDVDKLTHLSSLDVMWGLPRACMQQLAALPLQHLEWYPLNTLPLDDKAAWQSAPRTLTSLSVRGFYPYIAPGVLPHTITRLQLFNTTCEVVAQAAMAVMQLTSLDVSLQAVGLREPTWYSHADEGFQCLAQFTCLQSLGVLLRYQIGTRRKGRPRWIEINKEDVINNVPALATAAARGVSVRIVETEREFENKPEEEWPEASKWCCT